MQIPKNILTRLTEAKNLVVLTGAGISAESGIKTFRDPDGLWSKLNPAELASVDGFLANPELVWEWYQHRREIINSTKPNPGHYALADMEALFENYTLITQNVDRLHQNAGSKNVVELHGNIIENHCNDCKKPYLEDIDINSKKPPICTYCGGNIRPSVVWFGEMLPVEAITKAQQVAQECDVFLCIGTSAEVYPAAEIPMLAKRNGAFCVEINPNRTVITDYMNEKLAYPSGEVLPLLISDYKKLIERNL